MMPNLNYYVTQALKIHVQTSKHYSSTENVAFKWKLEVVIIKLSKCMLKLSVRKVCTEL